MVKVKIFNDKMNIYIYLPCAVLVCSVLYLWIDPLSRLNPNAVKSRLTSYDNANKALDRVGSWATWLSGLQTAAMAAMGLFSKDLKIEGYFKIYGFVALLFMGTSVILTTWLLSSLPSIQQRLVYTDKIELSIENDIYNFNIYEFIKLRLGPFTGLSHLYFLIGIFFWSFFIFNCFNSPKRLQLTGCLPSSSNGQINEGESVKVQASLV